MKPYGMMVRDSKNGAECQLCGSGGAGKDVEGIPEDRIYVDADAGAVSFRRILADDMGLGKTLQVIALLTAFYQEKPSRKRLEMKAVGQNYLFRL